MSSRAVALAVRMVRMWTRAYTLGTRAGVRDARVREIECDLWESQHDPDRATTASEILIRLVLGIPEDVLWRFERTAGDTSPGAAPATRAVTASAFTCSLALHLIALAAVVWWASMPATTLPPRVSVSRASALDRPTLLAGTPLSVPESEWRAKPVHVAKDAIMKKAALLIGTLVTTAGLPTVARQAASHPVFEAATVRPNTSGYGGWMLQPEAGGRLNGTNVPAAALIRFAYDLPDFQKIGGPSWLTSSRFDIAAKAEGDPPVDQKRLMLRAVLADRFKLTVHRETRELPIYVLVMARNDAKPGPQLRRTEADCAREAVALDNWAGVGPTTGTPRCGFFGFAPGTDLPKGRGGLAFRGLTLAAFAKRLVPMVRRSVSDQTGLDGYFDGDFDFVAELPPPPPPPGLPSSFNDPFVSVFTVLPEQLGLKLDARRGPVDVLVIDRIEQPARE